jgi:LacI family transcriptional regulator
MATMYDICLATGFSTATVSRVINNDKRVADRTRKKVLSAMQRLNYQPNQAARMLAGKQTDTLGAVLPEIDDGYYVRVLQGINAAVKKAGFNL